MSARPRHDGSARRLRARLRGFGPGKDAHARADHSEGAEEDEAEHQKPALGALTRAVAHLLVADAQVLALDGVGILALLAGVEDTGERA